MAAADTLAQCNAWRSSSGTARILLGNSIGASHYLTKMHKLQESPPEHPVELYTPSELQRICNGR